MTTQANRLTGMPVPLATLSLLWLLGWTLRVTVLAAPPLATSIATSFDLDEAGISALTMLPIVAIAFGAIPAALVINRFGVRAAMMGGIVVMVLASTARGYLPGAVLLFSLSLLMGLGVAVIQTALPVSTKIWTPEHIGLANAVYLNGMMVGEVAGAGLTLPVVMPLVNNDWRLALVLWAMPIVVIGVMLMLARLPEPRSLQSEDKADYLCQQPTLPKWNDARVWQFGVLLAGSIVTFYVINAFVGTVLRDRHESQALSGLLLAFNATPLLASFMMLIKPRWIGQRRPLAISALLSILGLAGFIFLTGWPSWIAAVIAGFAATVELILLVSLPAKIASGKGVTRLNAGMTLIGYGLAFLLPLIGGILAEAKQMTQLALIPSLLFAIAVLPALGRNKEYPDY